MDYATCSLVFFAAASSLAPPTLQLHLISYWYHVATSCPVSIIVQQDATMYSLLYFCKLLYMFQVVTPPIIRSTYNCNYSIWHWSTLENAMCVKSAKDERYGPYRLCYISRSYDRGM